MPMYDADVRRCAARQSECSWCVLSNGGLTVTGARAMPDNRRAD